MPRSKENKSDAYRGRLRDQHFGAQAWERAWQGPDEKGYACVPRVLPILLELAHASAVTGRMDCRSAYVELLTQNWGQGFIDIKDEQAHAMRSGYTSKRGVRTWQERIKVLAKQGFIEIKPKSMREIGYILLRHPNSVVADLRLAGKIDDQTWAAFLETCQEFGVAPPAQDEEET